MTKKVPKRKKNRSAFSDVMRSPPDVAEAAPVRPNPAGQRWYLIAIFVVIALGGTYLVQATQGIADVPRYTYKVVRKYPHDATAFTQGLVLDNGFVWESTGKYDGQSSIRKVDLETGEVLLKKTLPDDEFGEGLAVCDDRLFQLTWKNEVCYVYDRELNKLNTLTYNGHGWGLTYDGTSLIMSDGSARLKFIDPDTFETQRRITVRSGRSSITYLNELEYAGGFIYANRLNSDQIYKIDPENGDVAGIIDLKGLWTDRPPEGVLNGIAVGPDPDAPNDRSRFQLIVTGKYCPFIYEIEPIPKTQ